MEKIENPEYFIFFVFDSFSRDPQAREIISPRGFAMFYICYALRELNTSIERGPK